MKFLLNLNRRILLIVFIVSMYAFTLVKSEEKEQNQETCETVKFPGGDTAFYQFVYTNLDSQILDQFPDLTGYIFVSFIVDTAGSIISASMEKKYKLNQEDVSILFKEIKRVLLKSPKWEFFDLVKGDHYYGNEDRIDETIFDNNLPVDETEITIKSNVISTQKCKKQKVKMIYPFKFPIPPLYLGNKK